MAHKILKQVSPATAEDDDDNDDFRAKKKVTGKKRSKPTSTVAPAAKKSKKPANQKPAAGGDSDNQQVEWSTLWQMYHQVATTHAEKGNCSAGGIYDLVISATMTEDCDEGGEVFHDIDPLTAMADAKCEHDRLEEGPDKAAGGKLKFIWSPQSRKACGQLEEKYGSLETAWLTGWRWYPEPDPKNNAHGHRFYPPTTLLAKVKEQLVAKKAGLDEEALYMTSPSTCKYLLSTD